MSIAERLRKLAATADRVPIFADAADEIERLRAENAAWKHENNLAYAENERLKAALREIVTSMESDDIATAQSIADIARAALEGK